MTPCKKCKVEFEPDTAAPSAFCPKCTALIAEAQVRRQQEKADKEKEKQKAKDESTENKGKDKGGPEAELDELVRTFKEGPPEMQACVKRIAAESAGVEPAILVAALKATQYASARIPGSKPDQLLFVFIEAFKRNSSVVLGGSRVKSYFKKTKLYREANEIQDMGEEMKAASDLDIGYGNLKPGSAGYINAEANKLGPPPIEQMIIMEGQNSPSFGTLPPPEQFFHKEGDRPARDPKSKIEPRATPSGCITFAPDGTIQENGPDVPVDKLQIPPSGRKPRPMGDM
jgi:hypothetical protein